MGGGLRLASQSSCAAAMQQIEKWLEQLGLAAYAQRFADNHIDASVLRDLTEADLEKIGTPLGDRKKLMRAIAALDAAEVASMIYTTEERWAEAEMHRLRGALSLRRRDAAEASLRQALAVAERQSARFWELRAAVDLARLRRQEGKHGAAQALLAPVYGWFTEGRGTRVLREAKALLDRPA